MTIGDLGGQNPSLLIHAEVQFLPAFPVFNPVFLGVPLSLAADLQTRAVHDEGQRRIGQMVQGSTNLDGPIATGQRRMVRAGMVQAQQRQDRIQESFRLPQRELKQQTERQCGLNRQV